MQRFGLYESDLKSLPGSDLLMVGIAGPPKNYHNASGLRGWKQSAQQMKSAANVSQQLIRRNGFTTVSGTAKTSNPVKIC
jgi:hypothetical protein